MSPDRFHILVAGGGVAGIEAVLTALELAPDARVELVTPDPSFAYRPLSVVEPFARPGTRHVPYDVLAARGVTVTCDTLASVDADRRVVGLAGGDQRTFDALVVAIGALQRAVFPRVLTFAGPNQTEAMHGLVQDVEGGWAPRIAFAVPEGVTWTLPLYELALQLAVRRREMGVDAELRFLTPERRPLEVFGSAVAEQIEGLLERAGIVLHTDVAPHVPHPRTISTGRYGTQFPARRIVALPVLAGQRISGLPSDADGFVPIDEDGRVRGLTRVFAAGDGTTTPIKQGGLAAQQAERAVHTALAEAGLTDPPSLDPPALMAVLITGDGTWYLRRLPGSTRGEISPRPLWWPPGKVAGRHIAPFLDHLAAQDTAGGIERRLAAARLEGDLS